MPNLAQGLEEEVFYPETDGQPMAESDPTRDYLLYSVAVLDGFFRDRMDVYVSGNLFIYYRQGDPKAVVAPDVFIILGAEKRKRRIYKSWEEGGRLPSFVLEVTSKTTRRADEKEKPSLYASLGIEEYFQYDPTGDYLNPRLKGRRLVAGGYRPIPERRLTSGELAITATTLDLDLVLRDGELRYRDPRTGRFLPSYDEMEQTLVQIEQERDRAEQALVRTEQALRRAIAQLRTLGLSNEQIAETLGLDLDRVSVKE